MVRSHPGGKGSCPGLLAYLDSEGVDDYHDDWQNPVYEAGSKGAGVEPILVFGPEFDLSGNGRK